MANWLQEELDRATAEVAKWPQGLRESIRLPEYPTSLQKHDQKGKDNE